MKLQTTRLTTIILATMALSACGGGGGGDGDSSSGTKPVVTNPTTPVVTNPTTPVVTNPTPVEITASQKITDIGQKNHPVAALAAANIISLERQNCGLGGLSYDADLEAVATKHASYLKVAKTNTPITNLNPHLQQGYVGWEDYTGAGNPFYSGESFTDRLKAASYSTPPYYASENIAQSEVWTTSGLAENPEVAATRLARSLLAAPYHLRALVNPNRTRSGTSVMSYTPYSKDATKAIGYIVVDMAASESNAVPITAEGITTYPCNKTAGTATALYTESPDPTKGTGRNLNTDPIGQPVHILVSKANKIKVSNVKFYDVARKSSLPVDMIDTDQDPYKGTNYEIPKNEAFILPITDNLKSCENGKGGSKTNCGLMGNSEYEVSFDVLIDDKTMESKKFVFKTGNVNYT